MTKTSILSKKENKKKKKTKYNKETKNSIYIM